MNKKIYKFEGADSDKMIREQVTETGLYWRQSLKQWELWYIDDEDNKMVIGESAEQLGEEYALDMLDDFIYLAANEISGIADVVEKGEIC